MNGFRKIISFVMVFLLLSSITFQWNARAEGQEKEVFSQNLKIGSEAKKELSTNPADYLLKKTGESAGVLKDSYGYQYITFNKIADYSSTQMDFQLIYESDELYDKDRIATLEFYKEINNKLEFLGTVEFDTYGRDSGLMSIHLDKSLYKDKPYIYVRLGISADEDDPNYTDAIQFKASNPFTISPPPNSGPKKYAIISNESVVANQTEYTGAFKINNQRYAYSKKLENSAYRIDYNKPFNLIKSRDKRIKRSSLLPHLAYNIGDTRNFWVTNITTNTPYQINAKLTYSGTKANVWVYNNFITSQDAQKLGTEFDNRIYKSVTSNFASASDVDRDGKVNILCYDIQDGFNGSGGYVGGYFYAGDLFDSTNSNKSEIFYIDTYPAMGTGTVKDVTKANGTLAHEFQHMVNFNQSVFIEKGTAPMDVWLNEGLSMAAEQIYSVKVLTDRIAYYNATASTASGHSLLYWDQNGDVLANYALSYLMSQYIKLQTNKGDSIFKEILLDKNNNYKAVEDVVKKYVNPSLTFGKFMTNFRGALLLKQKTGVYGFKGVPEFNQLQPKLYNGSPGNLRGGGAIVKQIEGDFAIPASKGPDVTYTIVQDGAAPPRDTTPPGKPTVYSVSDKDIFVKGRAEAGSKVTVKKGKTVLGSAYSNSTGNFSIPIKAQKAGTILTVTARDKAKYESKATSVKVVDKTAPEVPKVDKITSRTTKVTGKAEPYSTVYVKRSGKKIGSAKVSKSGKFSVKILKQKAGKVLYIYAKDRSGNSGKSKKVTVKKR